MKDGVLGKRSLNEYDPNPSFVQGEVIKKEE